MKEEIQMLTHSFNESQARCLSLQTEVGQLRAEVDGLRTHSSDSNELERAYDEARIETF